MDKGGRSTVNDFLFHINTFFAELQDKQSSYKLNLTIKN